MTMTRRFATLAASVLIALPGVAQAAQEAPCLTPAEFTALSSYALPSLITGAAERCTAVLPGNAYLTRSGAQLAQRYAARKSAAWPGAKAAFLKVSGGNAEVSQLFTAMPDEALQPMVDGLISGMIGQKLPTERCGSIDRLASLLAPLPPENTAELIGLAVGLGSKSGKGKVGQFSICAA
ncbi:MAG TPA: hypothetical protein VHG29_00960 [Novosphingobium sp.]|nr:hypothetical protein [Novosphingobium sp.]